MHLCFEIRLWSGFARPPSYQSTEKNERANGSRDDGSYTYLRAPSDSEDKRVADMGEDRAVVGAAWTIGLSDFEEDVEGQICLVACYEIWTSNKIT